MDMNEAKKRRRRYVAIIGAVVGIILFVAVALPVTASVVAGLNTTQLGTTATTVVQLLPLMVAVGAIVFVVASVM